MPHSKKSKKIPMMFYQNISKEDLEKNNPSKKSFDFGAAGAGNSKNKQKQIWLWSAVSIIMVVILISWISVLPKQLKVRASGPNIEKELFSASGNDLSSILSEQKQKTDELKKMMNEGLAALSVSSSVSTAPTANNTTSTLSEKQIEKLKNKIEENKPQ